MKAKLLSIALIVLTGVCLSTKELFAYGNFYAHPALNAAMVNYAEVLMTSKLPEGVTLSFSADPNQYTGIAVTSSGKSYLPPFNYTEGEESHNALEWIKHGGFSADEPELQAAVRHFYDPVGLIGGKKWLTNRATYWEGVYSIPMNPETDAIEWALGDTPKGGSNRWTLVKAKESLVDALELTDETMKKSNLAKAFRALGEVLHNTGDMGCPPHTRNDSHAAPLGYSGGAVLGAPDAYEELFKPDWAMLYMTNPPDPELKSFFENATTIRSINEKLATFTNENFFSKKTINGSGINRVQPINKEDTYYSPNLQDQDIVYNPSDYYYYKTFPSGNGGPDGRVKMCTDKHGIIFNSRGYPHIDAACVKSQAQELVPDLVCAGAHIIRLFIPKLKVEITEAKTDGTVKGTVTHVKTTEYNETIYYSGKINILNDLTGQTLGTVNCGTGDFSGTVGSLKENDELYATVELGGIHYQSADFKITSSPVTFNNLAWVWIHLEAHMPTSSPDYPLFYLLAINSQNYVTIDQQTTLVTWDDAAFRVTYEYKATGRTYSGTIQGRLSDDGRKLISLTADQVDHNTDVNYDHTKHFQISLQNIDLTESFAADITGDALKNLITSVFVSEDCQGSECSLEGHWESNSIDYSSPPWFYFLLNGPL